MKLIIGNKNYSSWSLRGWLAAKLSGIPFEEDLIPLDTPEFHEKIGTKSPSRLVPALHDGDIIIWDSLAIIEYLNEKAPSAGFWPTEVADRALARSISAEMHGGFSALRNALPMNIRKHFPNFEIAPDVQANIDRIQSIWTQCLKNADGPFLFGKFGAADIMYAPVVHRFAGYDVSLDGPAKAYVQEMLEQPYMMEWASAGRAEEWIVEFDEV